MNCVILQPSYLPWRGYFHQIQKADVFVHYDDVQYDHHGWRNRNRIKTANGTQWITIPVLKKGAVTNHTPINAIQINWNVPWNIKHWQTLKQAYGRAPYFQQYAPVLEEFFARRPALLADFTIDLTVALTRMLGITATRFVRSSDLPLSGRKTDRLLEILQLVGATHYISGPSAQSYLEEEKLHAAGISLEYMEYNYPLYEQLYPPFDPHVSVVDLLFMVGPRAPSLIWGTQNT